ncbi:MAG: YidC/Oxa1 family insertase periplasmic-domain containing protein [Phycisphaeraceae bacterium]
MRIVIPLLAVGLALGLVLAVFVIHEPTPDAGQTADTAETAETQQADTPRDDASDHTGDSTPSNAPPAASGPATADSPEDLTPAPEDLTPAPEDDATDATAGAEAEDEAPAPVTPASLRIRTVGAQPEVELGSLDAETGYKLRVGLNVYGAAINAVDLTEYFTSVAEEEHYRLLRRIEAGDFRRFAYAAEAITIGEQTLDLATAQWEVVERGPGEAVFRLIIEDDAGAPVVELRRTYRLDADSYDLQLLQRIINRAGDPLEIAYVQNAQGDLTGDAASYLGDRRQFVVGYVKPSFDPARTRVYTESGFVPRTDALDGKQVWPRPAVLNRDNSRDAELTWFASENRYFAMATHPWVTDEMIAEGPTPLTGVPDLQDLFPRIETRVQRAGSGPNDAAVFFTLGTDRFVLGQGQTKSLDLGVFAGPRKESLFEQQPYAAMNFDEMIRYELGCTFCTFQWLADALLWYLKLIYGQIVTIAGMGIGFFDWGVAIILLVVTVRLLLHPITKRSQANMMKMSKQMSSLQPEIAKLRKKYKDDQKKLNQETMKLYREKGINPANALGCLPMFLQMPIWVALYAMLYFAIELRHEPAFYGVFQHLGALFGGNWPFLADLAVSDRFIPLMEPSEDTIFRLPIITIDYSAINILPPLMAVVMFFNMKFTQPPPPENETEEQKQQRRQQQMVMKIMPFLFPILLYSAPSGLTLYICASTAAGIFDSYLVRKHVRELEAAGKLFEKKPRKEGGLMDRLGKTVERKQQMMLEAQQKQQGKGGGGKGGGPSGGKQRKKR